MNFRFSRITSLLLLLCSAAFSVSVSAAEDLLIFPEIRALQVNDNASADLDVIGTVDFFATARYGQVRLLAEIFAAEDRLEAERFQIGYEITPLSSAWLGRMHNILGYWNTQYNHGTYLQTSITRPQIAEFEHNGGLFPSHTVGLLLESTHNFTHEAALDFSFSAGTSPELKVTDEGNLTGLVLHSMTLFNPGKGNHKLNLAARIIYRPNTILNNQFGAFASQIEIAVDDSNINTINLSIAGLLAYWEFSKTNIYSSVFFTQNSVESASSKDSGSFSSGYIQLDYRLHDDWTLFGRLENTYGEANDPYLILFENFSPETEVAGIRWDITRNQAIKFELSQKQLIGETFTSILLNWSAVFP